MQSRLQRIHSLLRGQSTLVLATAGSGGLPHSTPLFYLAQDDLRLYWFSSRTSRHSRNCAANPAASLAICRETADWRKICAIQMRGEVAAVNDRALRSTLAKAYRERFALGRHFRALLRGSTLYCFTPAWLRYLDNAVRFGYKFEMDLASRRV